MILALNLISDLNRNESFVKDNYISKLHVSDFYTSSSHDDDPEQKEEITPKKQLSRPRTKAQQKSHEISSIESPDDDEPLINLIQNKERLFHTFLPTPNYAKIKPTRPRQKAMNYRGQRIVKELFKTEEKKRRFATKEQ